MDFLKNIFENRIAGSNGSGGGGDLAHTISFMVDGNDYAKFSVVDGAEIPELVPVVKSGKIFRHWKDGDAVVTFPYTPQTDKTFIANITNDLVSLLYEYYSVDRTEYPYIFIWYDYANYIKIIFARSYSINSSAISPSLGKMFCEVSITSFVADPSNISEVVEFAMAKMKSVWYTSVGATVGDNESDFVYTNIPASTFVNITAPVYRI